MCVQLSLFDSVAAPVISSPMVSTPEVSTPVVASPASLAAAETASMSVYGTGHRDDTVHHAGALARMVLARYDMMARRREEMVARRATNLRKSIRVLSPS